MKTEHITCDECGTKINTKVDGIPERIKGIYDICNKCRTSLLEEYFGNNQPEYLKKLNCERCNGKGKYKDFYGYNNDFTWEICNCTNIN